MADLRMTATRAAVLRAVARGEVVHYRGWGKGEKAHDEWHGGILPKHVVTRACNDLAHATTRLIRPGQMVGQSIYSGQRWTCTACGRAVLRVDANVYGSAITEDCTRKEN